MRCLEARGTQDISLVEFTPMVLEMGHDYLTNRVTTSLTPVGKCTDAPEPLLQAVAWTNRPFVSGSDTLKVGDCRVASSCRP